MVAAPLALTTSRLTGALSVALARHNTNPGDDEPADESGRHARRRNSARTLRVMAPMRMSANAQQLRGLVESEFGGLATPLYVVPVRHVTGDLLWEGMVHVLKLDRGSGATEAYAWTCPFDGEDHAMLQSDRIHGPVDAVRTTLQASGWGPDFDEKRV